MLPKFGDICIWLRNYCGDGKVHKTAEAMAGMVKHFKLTKEEIEYNDQPQVGTTKLYRAVQCALSSLKKAGVLERMPTKESSFRFLPDKLKGYKPRHHATKAAPINQHLRVSLKAKLKLLEKKLHLVSEEIKQLINLLDEE